MKLFSDFKYKMTCFFNFISMVVAVIGVGFSLYTGSILWQIVTAIAIFIFFSIQIRLPSG